MLVVVCAHILRFLFIIQARFRQCLPQLIWWICEVDHGKSKTDSDFCLLYLLSAMYVAVLKVKLILCLNTSRLTMGATALQFNLLMRSIGMILLLLLLWYVSFFFIFYFCFHQTVCCQFPGCFGLGNQCSFQWFWFDCFKQLNLLLLLHFLLFCREATGESI